ncbi:MAG: transcriptional regulator [Pirellulaceae bacterium]|nr:MAG: transcriptional regulator [Pirellulaceae bacterium]
MTESAFDRHHYVRAIDQEVLDILRRTPGMTVRGLVQALGVTATAVRQRLDRLEDAGLIVKQKRVEGRGRPVFEYTVTRRGSRFAGVDYSELVGALWQEVLEIEDRELRERILQGVAVRLGRELKPGCSVGADLVQRMSATVRRLAERDLVVDLGTDGELPVLEMQCCPFPDLAMSDQGRHVCELEEAMLSEAVGREVHLDQCRLDGHPHCRFKPVSAEVAQAAHGK